MRRILSVVLFCISLSLYAQAQVFSVHGKVIDKSTRAVLPFVNLVVTGHPQLGATADIDGNFKISATFPIKSLSFTYVGFHDVIIPIKDTGHDVAITVTMQQTAYQLREVKILPGVNPALRIIEAAVKNRDKNNPEKMRSFAYYSYNKMYCTADIKAPADSLNSLDSAKMKKKAKPADTSKKKVETTYEFFNEQYLFLVESVSKRRYLHPDHNYEEVLASRTSGLKDSPFALLATQMQSFSFYPENVEILGESYLNPVSSPGIKRYYYVIEDTLYNGKDSVFVISFHPKKNRNFSGMKGVLYINTNGYAIQNVIAQPIQDNNTVNVHIQQKYEYVDNKQWFPVQLNTDMVYNNMVLKDTDIQTGNHPINPDDEHNKIKIVTRSYIKNISLDTVLRKGEFGRVEVEFSKDASKQTDAFWNKYRNDTLSSKEKKTYHVIDSIGQKIHLDRKLKWFESLATGKLREGFVDWDLDKFLIYNGYEKLRLGAGLHTNDEISKYFSVGGYGAYGFGDKAFKYGGDVSISFNPYSHLKLNFAYQNDVTPAGGLSFYNDQPTLLSTESYYNYFINNMDKLQLEKVSFSFDALRYFQFNLFGDEQLRQVTNNYQFGTTYNDVTVLYNSFHFTELGLGIRFAYKEKFMKSPLGLISLGTKYPIVWGTITKGFNNLLNGGFDYVKYDLKISKSFRVFQAGYSSIEVLAGYVNGNVPYTLLYNARATYQLYTVAVDNSFETMRINEFASSRYVNLFYAHDFKAFIFHTKKFKPHFKVLTSAGWGTMDNLSSHYDFAFKTMEKGYYESGIELNNLIKANFLSLGIGAFYRYGPYALRQPINNAAFMFTVYSAF
jgi:hypothetical protein